MIQAAVIGFGNVGKCAYEALQTAPDMAVRCIVEPNEAAVPAELRGLRVTGIEDIRAHVDVDVAILGLPTRLCPEAAEALLKMGIRTVDAFDTHGEIWDVKCRLDAVAREAGTAAVLAAGWDPGSDSLLRALLEAMAPKGVTYTNFGPGMSMGHSVVAKSVAGVVNALSVTIPTGAGVHRRMVYVQMEPGASFEAARQAILVDSYFCHDDTHVQQVEDVTALLDMGHGVHMVRKGVSGSTHNQIMEYSMRINNPALTGQVMVSMARAILKQQPGCYTMLEIPVIDLLPGEKEDLIRRLV